MSTLDWGQVTPEAANIERNEFVYIYNHDLSSPEKVERTIRFILGRLNHYDTQLPEYPKHIIKIDIRGQQISDAVCEQITKELQSKYPRPHSMTVTILKNCQWHLI